MITKENFVKVLEYLGFTKQGNRYSKHYEKVNCDIRIDIKKGEIEYPKTKGFVVNECQTCNLSTQENFVVLECVNRLLEKGYQPNHIELEPRWKLGHNAKSGRADIWVRTFKKIDDKETEEKESLLIIECKTADGEFNDAWKDTLDDGAQLFSYFQQERATKFLCLYTSDFVDDKIKNEYHLINVQDNDDLLVNIKEPKTYRDSKNNKELFATWKETYQQDSSTRGLFEPDIAAYEIGKNKYSISDLVEIDSESMQKKYNEFATILRQHNVSGHENAFDKLVNLFLAKVVDETNNPESLDFYWKGTAYDDYFHLQDRLQKLYKIGMEKFLGEDVTYIDNEEVEYAFRLFKNDPDATKKTILEYFRQLKFFTNNDFAFIDVHNEHLFYQNSAVLLKIVKMLQDIKLKTETQNQFLGDLFEGFLDQGVKQSEGQFFTPTPIVKFLISSLPLQQIIDETEIPQVIDYACGAGHFLNEYAEQIKSFVIAKNGNLSDYYGAIVGIEKEYRLSKVSKVASFMYGQDDIKIIYADALSNIKEVKNNTFSVLVANPPYSVKGFLETLTEEERSKFELIGVVSDIAKNNSIETFFVERAAQLLKIGGVAAIILPSSVLSNGNIYIKCREIILQHFDIVAIAEFGTGTFGKTGTNTVTLFLRRKAVNPSLAEHYKNRVDSWFNGDETKNEVFEDYSLLEAYCQHINVPVNTYKTLFDSTINTKSLMDYDIFKEYCQIFENDTNAKSIKKNKKITAKYKEEDCQNELNKYVHSAICEREKDKLYYFMLAKSNPQPVVVVKSPADSKANKRFLGYEWSGAKGNEGIKYLGSNIGDDDDNENEIARNKGINSIQTPLFNPHNLLDSEKINSVIRQNFQNGASNIPEQLMPFVSIYKLVDMLDFTRVSFDKQIKTSASQKIEIESKFLLVKLGDIAEVLKGKSITSAQTKEGNIKVVAGGTDYAYLHNEANRPANTITISASGANAGFVNFWREPIFASDCTTVRGKNDLHTLFLYNFLLSIQNQIFYLQKGSAQPHVYPDDLKLIQIPDVDEDIQHQIVSECEKVDEEYNQSRMTVEEYKKKIAETMVNVKGEMKKLGDVCESYIGLTYKPEDVSNLGTIVLRSSNIQDAVLDFNDVIRVNCDIPNRCFVQNGDVLVCVRNGSKRLLGKSAFINNLSEPMAFGTFMAICRSEIGKWIYLWMQTEHYYNQLSNLTATMSINQLTQKKLLNLQIPVPPIAEQQRIVSEIETYEAEISKAKAVMAGCAERKKKILEKYLK